MPVIEPSGLFLGERLAACSDLAQLYWPRLYCAANRCARLELHLSSLISQCFRNFKQPPTEAQLWQIFEEYVANFLVIPYRSANGRLWVEFATESRYLPKYKSGDDKSPQPPKQSRDVFAKGYAEWKLRHTETPVPQNFGNLSEIFQKSFGEVSETFQKSFSEVSKKFPCDVGVDVGVDKTRQDDDDVRARVPENTTSSSSSDFSLQSAQTFWNEHRGSMKESKLSLGVFYERLLAARVKDGFTQELCEQAIAKMAALPHFTGETNGNLGTLRWLLDIHKETHEPNFRKVLNGDYDPRKKKAPRKVNDRPVSIKDFIHA